MILAATVVSHHLTSILLVITLAGWLVVDAVVNRRRPHPERGPLLVLTGVATTAVIAWLFVPGNPVLGYLTEIADSSEVSIQQRFTGQTSRQLFQNSNGLSSPPWERIATVASILLMIVLILGAFRVFLGWFTRRRALLVLFGVTAALYPIIPLGHVTASTGEVTDRASGFLFVGVGVAAATGPLLRRHTTRRARWTTPLATVAMTVVFVGAIILGSGPTVSQLPGPYLVSADARTIDRFSTAAGRWEAIHLGDSRVYADRDSGLVAGAIGGQYVITHLGTGIDASPVLLAPTFTQTDVDLIRRADIDYVVVDQRDSRSLPNLGVYIESGEYDGANRKTPVPSRALRKLGSVPGVERIYTNGAIAIYDVRSLHR
ncbi:MAG: hypothetical protein INR72_18720 [Williamsia herbipolensis]|nr:hypothetical protein [Williamsia herbipolensis]